MIKDTVTTKNFNGASVTSDLYFNLEMNEILDISIAYAKSNDKTVLDAWTNYIRSLQEIEDGPRLVEEFQRVLLASFGVKSADGTRFEKSDEIRQQFKESPFFSAIYIRMFQDPEYAAKLFNGIPNLDRVQEVQSQVARTAQAAPQDYLKKAEANSAPSQATPHIETPKGVFQPGQAPTFQPQEENHLEVFRQVAEAHTYNQAQSN